MGKKASWILMLAGVIEEITRFNITKFFGNQDYVNQYLVSEGRVISIFSHPIGYAIVLTFFLSWHYISLTNQKISKAHIYF